MISLEPNLLLERQLLLQLGERLRRARHRCGASGCACWMRATGAGYWVAASGAQQLRQASPLVTVLSQEVRQGLLAQAAQLRGAITLGAPGETAREAAAQEWS